MREALDALVKEMVDKGILYEEARIEFDRHYLARALERSGGSRSLAAQALGMHRNTLSRKLEELNGSTKPPAKKPARRVNSSHVRASRA